MIDGTCLDIPDSDENAKVFGRPGSRTGTRAAFSKARLVILVEAGTHLIFDALMCAYKMEERVRALKLLRSVSKSVRKDQTMLKQVNIENTSTEVTQYMGARLRVFLSQEQDKTLLKLRTTDVPQKVKDARRSN